MHAEIHRQVWEAAITSVLLEIEWITSACLISTGWLDLLLSSVIMVNGIAIHQYAYKTQVICKSTIFKFNI